jgi:hypothetical protein
MRASKTAIAGLVVASGVVLGGTAIVIGDEAPLPRPGEPAPDATPARAPAVAAVTEVAGQSLGVATYRNRDGRVCAASGFVDGDRLVGHGGRPLPYGDAGNCSLRPDPVAVQVVSFRAGAVPVTVVWGLASDDAERVRVHIGASTDEIEPGRDGAFVAAAEAAGDPVRIDVERPDRAEVTVDLPAPPDLDEITAGARRHDRARAGGEPDR